MGAVVYSFVGTEQGRLKSFSEYYSDEYDAEIIESVLTNLFEHAWGRQYFHGQSPTRLRSLFEQYDEAWSHRLSQRLPSFQNKQRHLYFPGIDGSLPNPVLWALDNKDNLIIRDARIAVTHGDLHGENLLVEDEHGYCWVIDFERRGTGPILRDFITLELDLITRLTDFPEHDLSLLYEFVIALAHPITPSGSILETAGLVANNDTNKALNVIEIIRALAQKMTHYREMREYLGGLLLNALFVATITSEDDPAYMRALLLASVLCGRLDQWPDLGKPQEWPPKNWPPYDRFREELPALGHSNLRPSQSHGDDHRFGHSSRLNTKIPAQSCSKPQEKVSSYVGHERLSFEERAKLVEHLLAIPSMVDRSRLATVISQLRPEIKTNVAYSSADKTYLFNIVETCLQHPNGMQELRDILQFFEHDSLPMQQFKEALNRLLPRE